jgi:Fe-S cluster assembly iron-binding protein IscA
LTDAASAARPTLRADGVGEAGDACGARARVSSSGGFRAMSFDAGSGLQGHEQGDEVIEEQGVRVFLEQEAASLLDDEVLDATVEQNQVAFTIADQVEE